MLNISRWQRIKYYTVFDLLSLQRISALLFTLGHFVITRAATVEQVSSIVQRSVYHYLLKRDYSLHDYYNYGLTNYMIRTCLSNIKVRD